ncbi:hypothetical protein [Novosphingobium endophyticum]|uniref:hypothetical protein n=1 Tax=Novosphingobium endophyticum TaxID=1955250 RepID=UPI0027E44379|nr:hypothetical protein [Novosphingobium endophyticum]
MRDRRGPLTAIVLTCGYALVVIEGLLGFAWFYGWRSEMAISPTLKAMLLLCLASLLWRGTCRMVFTAREYGWTEGMRAVLRMPVANIIVIMAGRRALARYVRTLRGGAIAWDKTRHDVHPAGSEAGVSG